MSITRRKIGFYSISFTKEKKLMNLFDEKLFQRVINYILNDKSNNERLINDDKSNKAITLDKTEFFKKDNHTYFKMVFNSCKYNHSPDYMSSIDGSVRVSQKQLIEGDKESTHILGKLLENELILILEERRSGISIKSLIGYLNQFLVEMSEDEKLLTYSTIVAEKLIETLDKLDRISIANITLDKKYIGSDYLMLEGLEDEQLSNDIVVTCKSKRAKSLNKSKIRKFLQKFLGQETKVTRVRIQGVEENKNPVIIDTEFFKKQEFIEVTLDEKKGIVDSTAFFDKAIVLLYSI